MGGPPSAGPGPWQTRQSFSNIAWAIETGPALYTRWLPCTATATSHSPATTGAATERMNFQRRNGCGSLK